MEIRVLGCSGGIGGRLRTTCLLLDGHTLIDAGTGLGDLSLDELVGTDRVFITHSHLDHIALLPLLLDSVGSLRTKPLLVYASAATLQILSEHIFNWKIWPDFRVIPTQDNPYLRFVPLAQDETVDLPGNLTIKVLPALHTVPAVGYQVSCPSGSLAFTGDTTINPAFWPIVNAIPDLKVLIIESAFCNKERELAIVSQHLCPAMLADELEQLQGRPDIYITHLKPGEYDVTMREILEEVSAFQPKMLQEGLTIYI